MPRRAALQPQPEATMPLPPRDDPDDMDLPVTPRKILRCLRIKADLDGNGRLWVALAWTHRDGVVSQIGDAVEVAPPK